jgi:4-diphosphocytidyl-2-C-methyl-D-erythritol kinase
VIDKRSDGYHDLKSVMQTISIRDDVEIDVDTNRPWELQCDKDGIPTDERNLAWKAAKVFYEQTKLKTTGIAIRITKRIPMEAGLGGGSSDAAAVVCALNMLLDTKLSEEELMAIGATVGADVPFLVFRGTAFVQGIGDKIERCNPLRPVPVLVAYPHSEKVSTGKAYAAIDARGEFSSTEDFEKMKAAVLAQDIERIGALSYNIFESVIDESSDIFRIKKEMLVHGAVFSLMSGSGSAVFGIYRDTESAQNAAQALSSCARVFVAGMHRE